MGRSLSLCSIVAVLAMAGSTAAMAQELTLPTLPGPELNPAAAVLGVWSGEDCTLTASRVVITTRMIEIVTSFSAERVEVTSYRAAEHGDVAAISGGLRAVGRHSPEGGGIMWIEQPLDPERRGEGIVLRRAGDTLRVVGRTGPNGEFHPFDRREILVLCK
jgi:hypothetical protein